ncbi:MAG TPA: hypothetical protein VMM13_02745 [Euzebya sp.]|nr:hypothetical protein [Euzebya sp.]
MAFTDEVEANDQRLREDLGIDVVVVRHEHTIRQLEEMRAALSTDPLLTEGAGTGRIIGFGTNHVLNRVAVHPMDSGQLPQAHPGGTITPDTLE